MTLGLLNVDEPEFVGDLVRRASNELAVALALPLQPSAASYGEAGAGGSLARARLLLRFLASLSVVNVVNASGVMAAMEAVVGAATAAAAAASGGGVPEGHRVSHLVLWEFSCGACHVQFTDHALLTHI